MATSSLDGRAPGLAEQLDHKCATQIFPTELLRERVDGLRQGKIRQQYLLEDAVVLEWFDGLVRQVLQPRVRLDLLEGRRPRIERRQQLQGLGGVDVAHIDDALLQVVALELEAQPAPADLQNQGNTTDSDSTVQHHVDWQALQQAPLQISPRLLAEEPAGDALNLYRPDDHLLHPCSPEPPLEPGLEHRGHSLLILANGLESRTLLGEVLVLGPPGPHAVLHTPPHGPGLEPAVHGLKLVRRLPPHGRLLGRVPVGVERWQHELVPLQGPGPVEQSLAMPGLLHREPGITEPGRNGRRGGGRPRRLWSTGRQRTGDDQGQTTGFHGERGLVEDGDALQRRGWARRAREQGERRS
mmetsp:Transcript_980/g.3219  ORF Transcript_980/g.3219 Transcript_980/m.3219 type:complete len:355 (-) Transcript_980:385-1449(-)